MDRKHISRIGIILTIAAIMMVALGGNQVAHAAAIDVLMHRYDWNRTGANINETTLTTTNVNVSQFGKIAELPVTGDIYAQPLYVTGVSIPGKGTRNVVYVETEHNNLYAFDADDPSSSPTPLWTRNTGSDFTNVSTVDIWDGYDGILGTPTIDKSTNTMYFVSHTGGASPVHTIYAIDISTGLDKVAPKVISATIPGTGAGSVGGSLSYDANHHLQRPGLLLLNGYLYIGIGSIADIEPYHGWVFSYRASDLSQVDVINFSANQYGNGLWQSGASFATDGTSFYATMGNGISDYQTGGSNIADTVLKFTPNNGKLVISDWFMPTNECYLSKNDFDLGINGTLLIPGTNRLVQGGKQGIVYILDSTNMGHYENTQSLATCTTAAPPGTAGANTQIVQWFQAGTGHMHGVPVYWNGPTGPVIYTWTENDYAKGFTFNGSTFNTIPFTTSQSPVRTNGMPSGQLSLSANGATAGTGIVWAAQAIPGHEYTDHMGIIRALDANDLTHELWNSEMNSARDGLGIIGKFGPAIVVNGKVYVNSFSNKLDVYGLLPVSATNTPTKTNTPTPTKALSDTPTPTLTPSQTNTLTPTLTNTLTLTPTLTNTLTSTPTLTNTLTVTPSLTTTKTPTTTATKSPVPTATATKALMATPTSTPCLLLFYIVCPQATKALTATPTLTPTKAVALTQSPTLTQTPTASKTPMVAKTATSTPTWGGFIFPVPFSKPRAQASIGLYDPQTSAFTLYPSLTSLSNASSVKFGTPKVSQQAVAGDWNGSGTSSVGLYDASNTTWQLLINGINNTTTNNILTPPASTWKPIVGDWNGSGKSNIGLYDPVSGKWYLHNADTTGSTDVVFTFGPTNSTWLPVVGDWDGNGTVTVGLYDPTTNTWHLRHANSSGPDDLTFTFGSVGSTWLPVAGNWNGTGPDTIGLYNPQTGQWLLRYTNTSGDPDLQITTAPGMQPVVGHWPTLSGQTTHPTHTPIAATATAPGLAPTFVPSK